MFLRSSFSRFSILLALMAPLPSTALAGEWSVPLAGNLFRSAPEPGGGAIGRQAGVTIGNADEVHSVYFRTDRAGTIRLGLKGRSTQGTAEIRATVNQNSLTATLQDAAEREYPLGEVKVSGEGVSGAGYVRVDLQKTSPEGTLRLSDLLVSCDDESMSLGYVKTNEGNMFYWGRRGPSVHLRYRVPTKNNLTYAYNEITVPEGQDAIGSYFMSNGFGEGYFGFQVNSESERRVLFSVWSPFHTDNPQDIPAEDRIVTLAKGDGVTAQDFGNEGSGGQSFLVYPWRSATTYRFLTEVKPDGAGNTEYTSWFGDKTQNEWRLIATFRRPKTDTHLTGFHSFLENFSPAYGHVPRSANYANQWVRDVEGQWHESTGSRFTADATARGRHRLDYAGGASGDHFFMRNCGFFADPVALDQDFERESSAGQKPEIDFDELPR